MAVHLQQAHAWSTREIFLQYKRVLKAHLRLESLRTHHQRMNEVLSNKQFV